jgi:hypothetical protein
MVTGPNVGLVVKENGIHPDVKLVNIEESYSKID